MSGYLFAVALTAIVLAMLFVLMRTRRIREKYAAVWIALALAVIVLGIFPRLAFWVAALVGVETPANLLFALAFVVLLLVCIQLSVEVSGLEEETRTLAEEIALLRYDVDKVVERPRAHAPEPEAGGTDPAP
ncbi:DUF2304 domain-containing protein [Cellulomonas citrea]|uniref:DUF2304 domain-containing protein n=1 Tax=Cellulomonas citrea TaxID=1909423 RepID=UPI00135908EE|nr:DUF2304 domain-containing protein [Cellulomonas citrea]